MQDKNREKTVQQYCRYCHARQGEVEGTRHKYTNINANPKVSHKYSVFALQFDPDPPSTVFAACLILLEQNSSCLQ